MMDLYSNPELSSCWNLILLFCDTGSLINLRKTCEYFARNIDETKLEFARKHYIEYCQVLQIKPKVFEKYDLIMKECQPFGINSGIRMVSTSTSYITIIDKGIHILVRILFENTKLCGRIVTITNPSDSPTYIYKSICEVLDGFKKQRLPIDKIFEIFVEQLKYEKFRPLLSQLKN